MDPELGRFEPLFKPNGFWQWEVIQATPSLHALDREERRHQTTMPAKFHGEPRPDTPRSAAAATVGRRILMFSNHYRPTHTSLPPFLNPLNSLPWSLFVDSSLFERYGENKFGRLLDRVFRLPQQPLDQCKGTSVFLDSWAFS